MKRHGNLFEQTFTRERLLEALYQWDSTSDSNTLEVFISRLRRKLGSPLIQTVRGTGYRFSTRADVALG